MKGSFVYFQVNGDMTQTCYPFFLHWCHPPSWAKVQTAAHEEALRKQEMDFKKPHWLVILFLHILTIKQLKQAV